MSLVTLLMSISGYSPTIYIVGVLSYAFSYGMANAAFTAILLFAIGQGLASTKYALLSSLGNISPMWMTAFDGWLYDTYSPKTMLLGETFMGGLKSSFQLSFISLPRVKVILLPPTSQTLKR